MKKADSHKSGWFSRLTWVTTLGAAIMMVSGCSTTGHNQASPISTLNKTSFSFERATSSGAVVSEVYAVPDRDGLSIYGKVKRTADNCCDAARGHVDIEVVGPDGIVVDTVSIAYSPRNIPKARSRSSRFTARLPYVVPQDVPLRVTYRGDTEDTFMTTDRQENLVSRQNPSGTDKES